MGRIIQNFLGYGIKRYSRNCESVSNNEAKVSGLLWGVKLAKTLGIQNIIMERESMIVIKVELRGR